MSSTAPTSVTAAPVDVVSEYFGRALDALASWKDLLAADLAAAHRRGPVTSDALDALVAPYAWRTFDSIELPIYGTGFVAALDSLADARSHLAWWQGAARTKLVLASQSVNKEHIDYSELEWYRVPLATGETHVAGPYVDYLCSDEYTITVAAPVMIDGEFAGVAALDLLIDRVERDLTPQLAALGGDFSIINGVGRVVISTNPRHETGDRITGDDLAAFERFHCPNIALDVLVG